MIFIKLLFCGLCQVRDNSLKAYELYAKIKENNVQRRICHE